ncbi:glutamate receptor ionotropic, NMDA 3A-like isoform X2 [Wyeomyia smithii]|uniref:glutamate receptor ionotropic, NMDA 3A-like isoform X2 n=1 Tax=Wyeomyia smithii TaxID=174621 RepID=UPI002467C9AC|nr:glutamate receptor ionotropic, NMDA 3A-like isoform X2 [Wyeomyia smithii]
MQELVTLEIDGATRGNRHFVGINARTIVADKVVIRNLAQSGRSLKRGSKLSKILDLGLEMDEQYKISKSDQTLFKSQEKLNIQWNGIVADLISGSADMSFAPLSVSRERAEVIDFSVPFFHGGVSLLAAPQTNPDVPLLAFLLPFSPELWIAIFTSLNVTAIAVAIYEWLSPFGLNPWGRQRSKNFSMSSALWVMWGLLCGHLVAFKAPKSWPNKFLINVWGGFSVIFVASYTANIAALIAGLFFHNEAGSYNGPLLKQRIGAPIATATEYYVQQSDKMLWEHMKKYQLQNIVEGINRLKNGTLDLLMADSPILDYYRATDHGCSFQRVGDTYVEDSYAIGMHKGFPLKETISALISKYSADGYLDILTEKWYGGLACFKIDRELGQPKPLGVAAVAGVFLLLSLGMLLGFFILIFEHLFFKYTLPILRHQPKNTIWKSRNIMFFSQKLYRFINCVELVSPHHAAKELVHTIRQGQITSLFQKSIKREDEQKRRRKSRAQFFDMIQEIRRTMYLNNTQEQEGTSVKTSTNDIVPGLSPSTTATFTEKDKHSPNTAIFSIRKHKSNPTSLNVRRFSTDSVLSERLDTIGRRLSREMTNSPPDLLHRFETFGRALNGDGKFDTYSGKESKDKETMQKYDTLSGKIEDCTSKSEEKIPELPKKIGKHIRRAPLKPELYVKNKKKICEEVHKLIPINERVAHGLAPSFIELDTSSALLRDKLHEELRMKYGSHGFSNNDRKSKTQNKNSYILSGSITHVNKRAKLLTRRIMDGSDTKISSTHDESTEENTNTIFPQSCDNVKY